MPVNIHGKEYVTVAERVHAFREKYGDSGYIRTDLLQHDDRIVMKATVGVGDFCMGEGHAEEKRGSSQINRTSALENCETSCIGRALAASGFGVEQQYASGDEVKQAIHQQSEDLNAARTPADRTFAKGQYQDCTVGWVWPRDPAYIDRISTYKQDPMGQACAMYISEHAEEHAEKMLAIKAKKAAKAKEKMA